MGPAFVYGDILDEIEVREIARREVEEEIARFQAAVDVVRTELAEDAQRVSQELGQAEADVFLVHSMILEDASVIEAITARIESELVNAETAVAREMKRLSEALASSEDEYLRDRSYDVNDIGKRLIERMLGVWAHCPLAAPMIVVARELRASDTVTMDRGRILGFVTELGGKETHAAILARSLGVPAVVGATDVTRRARTGDTIIVDGDEAKVIIGPPGEVIERYRERRVAAEREMAELAPLVGLPAVTRDGVEITLMANVGSVEEAREAARLGADGIGLFRTELVFMAAEAFLSEDEQFDVYRRIAEPMEGRPVVIRTLDIGGDKFVGAENPLREHNPYLGYRSIRALLDHPKLFARQLKAILRAAAYGNVRMLWPMIGSVEELRDAKSVLEDAVAELRAGERDFRENVPIGVMIEVPAAAVVADRIAAECDFLSIGTNDLVQYTLAVDRGNIYVDHLYRPHDPAVLSLISCAVRGARASGKPIALCGEMAAEPRYVPLLIGLGLREFSVAASRLLSTKKAIRETDSRAAALLAERAVAAAAVGDVERLLDVEGSTGA